MVAHVSVPLSEYQEGRLPPVCAISGEPTDDVLVYRTVIPPLQNGRVDSGRLRALETLLASIDVRRPRDVLLGRLPVADGVRRRLVRARRLSGVALAACGSVLVVAAWLGAWWSPAVATGAIVVGGMAAVRRRMARQVWPRPTMTHGGTLVTVDNVHEAFAAAVVSRG